MAKQVKENNVERTVMEQVRPTKGQGRSQKGKTKGVAGSQKGKTKKQSALQEELKDLAGVEARRDIVRLSIAGLLFIITLFLTISLVSNVFTGAEDQSGVLSGFYFDAANKGGYLGACISHFLMNQLFGFGTLLVPVFLVCVVLKLMLKEACPLRMWITFVHSTIIMILVSIDATFLQNNVLPTEWVNYFGFELGGLHGKELVGMLEEFVGTLITFVILAALTVAYIGYWFTQVFIWIFKGVHKIGRWVFGRADDEEELYDDTAADAEDGDETDGTDNDADESDHDDEDAADMENIDSDTADNLDNNENYDQDEGVYDKNDAAANGAGQHVVELSINGSAAAETLSQEVETVIGADGQPKSDGVTINSVTGDLNLDINETEEEISAGTRTVEGTDSKELLPYDPKLDLERYQYPPVSLLEKHTSTAAPTTTEELNANKDRIIHVLRNFSVEISAITATVGPTVTLYEITPAPGVRIAKIRSLEDDIALSLSALGIRIIAPIPGKGTIGIEVPNARPQVVSMESIINTQKFRDTKYELPIALGKTITNEMFMVDLAKMPHLLVAGATGQGKSVGLNAIITSLLYKKHPSELKLVMVDPKKVEFSMYNPIINHFLAQVPDSEEPVITDVKKVVNTLKSLCQEMDERYDLLKQAGCRNIKEYNAKFCERHLLPSEGHKYLPYIVVIIDEFGDLIMTAGKDIELPIARIAQLARAVGIHMVIATQSPRATIITGKIKANFPARMAFRVSQGVESQTILDRRGANNLIGRGDMLFQAGSELTRVQCAFVDTPEVVAIAKHIKSQQSYGAPFDLPLVVDDGTDGTEGMSSTDGTSTFEQVARYVVNTQTGSTSKIQRKFSIGFNRAGRLMDQLEDAGIVGPQIGAKPREVLVQSELELQRILTAMQEAGQHFE